MHPVLTATLPGLLKRCLAGSLHSMKGVTYKLYFAGAGPSNSAHFFLTACAQFKDEDTILQEWLVHYIREGVQHFYLIDDGSTDTSQDILRPFITRGLVTLMVDDRKAHTPALSMVERYNLLFQPFFHSSTWMLHVDLDEFLYGRGMSIAGYLRGVAPEVGCISVPWKHFGSSGHVEQPRQGIVQSFLWRETFQKGMLGKSIFRTAAVRSIDMHWQMLKPGYRSGYPMAGGRMGSQSALSGNTQHLDGEQLLEQLAIHLNHYRVRWRKWYVSVKMTRGIADRDVSVYDEDYFERFNAHDILDDELAIRQNRSKRAPALPRDRTL